MSLERHHERIFDEKIHESLGKQLFLGYIPMGLSEIRACTKTYTLRGQYKLLDNRVSIERETEI